MTFGVNCCGVMWSVECSDYDDCPGPPPVFHLPPPPRPPFLHELPDCSININTCNAIPVIDAEYHSSPALTSLAVIIISSLLLMAMLLVATALVCKHKKRMRNLLPCKTSSQNHCELTHSNGVIYEDLTNMRPRSLPQPSIEMVDVKGRGTMIDISYARSNFPVLSHSPVFICPPPPSRIPLNPYNSQDLYNPVYEELSNGSGGRDESEGETESTHNCQGSEDEFAEDELSLCGLPMPSSVHSNFDNLRYIGHNNHSFTSHQTINAHDRKRNYERRPRSLERPRNGKNKLEKRHNTTKTSHNHHGFGLGSNIITGYKGNYLGADNNLDVDECLLLDALLRIYPQSDSLPYISGSYTRLNTARHHCSQQTVPCALLPGQTAAPAQDSDSGYSHNTDRQNINTIHTTSNPIHKYSHTTSLIHS